MSIERKDRSFDKIFEEVTFDRIPMDYVLDFDSIKEDIGLTVNDVFDKMFGKTRTLLGDNPNNSDSNPPDLSPEP
jgi:hypothetical protein